MPTKNLGGQKQLIKSPKAKTIPIKPLFMLLPLLRIFIPPILHNKQKMKFCYKTQKKNGLNLNFKPFLMILYYSVIPVLTASKSSSSSFEGGAVNNDTTTMQIEEIINAGSSS